MYRFKCVKISTTYFWTISAIFLTLIIPFNSEAKAPTVTITAPSDGIIVSGTVNIFAIVNHNKGIAQVEFSIGDTPLCLETSPLADDKWTCEWDTDTGSYADGEYSIHVTATDFTGNTATDSITVTVNNQNQQENIAPTVDIFYTFNGYTYYFYPYDSYDSDGFIERYKYTIFKKNNFDEFASEEIASYEWDKTFCPLPDPSSGFCLFFTCPYVCYEFPIPSPDATDEYRVEMIVWDNEGLQSDTATEHITINSSAQNETMYVKRISYTRKLFKSSTTIYWTVSVASDSNLNGTNDSEDLPVSDVLVKLSFMKDSDFEPDGVFDEPPDTTMILEGITDSDGEAVFVIRNLTLGDYRAQVQDLQDLVQDLRYDPTLDNLNPRDVTNWH